MCWVCWDCVLGVCGLSAGRDIGRCITPRITTAFTLCIDTAIPFPITCLIDTASHPQSQPYTSERHSNNDMVERMCIIVYPTQLEQSGIALVVV